MARSTRRKPPPELDEFLSPFDEALAETVLRLRDRVLSVMPNAHEVVWDAVNAVSIAFTPTTRWQDGICHIATYSKHANLGFNEGAQPPRPNAASSKGPAITSATSRSARPTTRRRPRRRGSRTTSAPR